MTEPNSPHKKPVRYMDFIGKKPNANADPLASRPAARPVKKPEKVEKVRSVSDQIPPKGAAKPAKAFISRKPATSKDLYPEPALTKPITKPAIVSKPRDDLALKASAAISGTSQPAEKKPAASAPDNNAYSLGGKSPFLPNYNVDKRPLSNSVKKQKDENFEKLSFLGVNEESDRKKNVYEKKEKPEKKSKKNKSEEKESEKKKTVKIIDDTKKKRGVPVWLIIILTILLGAGVGAGVYFLLPK